MILTGDEVERIARTLEGSLEEVPFSALLFALARTERSLTLEITREPLAKEIILERGVPIQCRSNLAHETLSRFMQSTGLLDDKTATECFAESCSKGVRFGDVLIERGIIQAEELHKVLQQNLARKLLDGFSLRRGTYRLTGFPPEIDSTLKVNVPQLIVIGVTRFASQTEIDSSISPVIGAALGLHPKPFFPLDGIRLNSQQESVVEALKSGSMRVDELATATGIADQEITRLVYALSAVGAVLPADQILKESQPTPSGPPQRPATTPKSEHMKVKVPGAGKRRDELMKLVLNYRRKDAFELLGVKTDSRSHEVHDQYLEFAEKYAPWTYRREMVAKAREVFLAGARAYCQLIDPDRRQEILDRRAETYQESQTPTPAADTFRIRTKLLDPEVQFKRGKLLMNQGNHQAAIKQLNYASDLDPQNSAYRAELAYCRFLHNPTIGGQTALDELKETLRIDPRCGLALFYSGEVHRHMGRLEEAEQLYQQAIKPMAPDRRPIDALRDLQQEKSSKKER